jgi:hypothetical protein
MAPQERSESALAPFGGLGVKRANGQNSGPVLPQRRAGLFLCADDLPIEESGRSVTHGFFLRVCANRVLSGEVSAVRGAVLCSAGWIAKREIHERSTTGPRTAHPSQNRRRDAAPRFAEAEPQARCCVTRQPRLREKEPEGCSTRPCRVNSFFFRHSPWLMARKWS